MPKHKIGGAPVTFYHFSFPNLDFRKKIGYKAKKKQEVFEVDRRLDKMEYQKTVVKKYAKVTTSKKTAEAKYWKRFKVIQIKLFIIEAIKLKKLFF